MAKEVKKISCSNPNCNNKFIPKRTTHKYCSDKCYSIKNRGRYGTYHVLYMKKYVFDIQEKKKLSKRLCIGYGCNSQRYFKPKHKYNFVCDDCKNLSAYL